MVRINEVHLKEGCLDRITEGVKKVNKAKLCFNGIMFVIDFVMFCYWVYLIVTSEFKAVAILAALVVGFYSGHYWNNSILYFKNQFCLDISKTVESLYKSDLVLLCSKKNCALAEEFLIDFGNEYEKSNVVKDCIDECCKKYFSIFKLDLSDLPGQSDSILAVNLIQENPDIPLLKVVIVDEKGN